MANRTLTKRAYDARLFSVIVTGKLRDDEQDATVIFDSVVVAQTSPPAASADMVVAKADPDVTDDRTLNFTASGGTSGRFYAVALRYSTPKESQLESVVAIEVV